MFLCHWAGGRDFKLTISTKIKKVSSVKMLRHIIFHKWCLVIYKKLGLKCLKLSAQEVADDAGGVDRGRYLRYPSGE